MTFWVLTFIAEMLEVKGTLYFFDTFMEKRDGGYRNMIQTLVLLRILGKMNSRIWDSCGHI